MKNSTSVFEWENGFPPVYSHTSISFLKSCLGFAEAKNGDARAAASVVNQCVKQARLLELRKKYPDAVLIPVMTKNKLPEALAEAIGLKIHTGIRMLPSRKRKTMSAVERLLYKPEFTGAIKSNTDYILVDDIVSQGGTISALRRYVLGLGGSICAVTALASTGIKAVLSPSPQSIEALTDRFSRLEIINLLKSYHITEDISELTNSEVHYLLRFKQFEKLQAKISNCVCNPLLKAG